MSEIDSAQKRLEQATAQLLLTLGWSVPVGTDFSDIRKGLLAYTEAVAALAVAAARIPAVPHGRTVACPDLPDADGTGQTSDLGEGVCSHGTALDVHCCHCHSGFIFDTDHECPPRHAPEALAQQRDECARIKAFLRKKGTATPNLRDATTYAEAAALIDAYLEALEAIHGDR